MRHTHSRFRLVDILPAGTASAVGVDADVAHLDINIHFLSFRHDRHCCRRRMDTSLGFGFGNALDTVDAAFKFHVAVDVAAGHHEDDFFETTKPRRTGIHEFHAPPLGFGIAGVHAEKVPSKGPLHRRRHRRGFP